MDWIALICNAPGFARFSEAEEWARALDRDAGDLADYRRFRQAVYDWQHADHAEIRLSTHAVARGEAREPRTHALLRVLAAAPSHAPELVRGITLPRGVDVEREFGPGVQIQPGLSSFTTSMEEAEYRARRSLAAGGTSIIFRLEPGAKAVPIENLAYDESIWEEREWYTVGRFRCCGVRDANGMTEILLSQTGVYLVQ